MVYNGGLIRDIVLHIGIHLTLTSSSTKFILDKMTNLNLYKTYNLKMYKNKSEQTIGNSRDEI
jgi:hypothetical protein